MHVTLIKKWDICAPAAILAAIGKDGLQVTKNEMDAKHFSSVRNIHEHSPGPVNDLNWGRDRLQ